MACSSLDLSCWDSLYFLGLIDYFLSHIREVFNYNLFKYFLRPFLCLSFFWELYNLNVGMEILFQRSLRLSSILFILISLFCCVVVISTILPSRSFIYSSASVILLLIPSREFLISFIVLFMIVCLLFSSSRSFLTVLYFLHSTSKILDHLYYHYSEFFLK